MHNENFCFWYSQYILLKITSFNTLSVKEVSLHAVSLILLRDKRAAEVSLKTHPHTSWLTWVNVPPSLLSVRHVCPDCLIRESLTVFVNLQLIYRPLTPCCFTSSSFRYSNNGLFCLMLPYLSLNNSHWLCVIVWLSNRLSYEINDLFVVFF